MAYETGPLPRKEELVGEPEEISNDTKRDNVDHGPETGVISLREDQKSFRSTRALWGYLVLNLSTGPTSAMLFSYLPAAIQTTSNAIGHVPGSDDPCAVVGAFVCVVNFGPKEVDYLTYLLYLNSIARALTAVFCIITSGIADYSRFRKAMMMVTIYLFGVLALPLAGLTAPSYSTLEAQSAIYCALMVVSGVFMITQASYIPMFMASKRGTPADDPSETEPRENQASWAKGALVSVWAMVVNNLGQILAVLVGLAISYSQTSSPDASTNSYLLAMTISGAITIPIAAVGQWLLPSIAGVERPKNTNIILLPFQTCWRLICAVSSYPEAFKFCIGWALWDASWFNFVPLFFSLFLQETGLDIAARTFTVFTLIGIVVSCLGSLGWMYAFPRVKAPLKMWLYLFLGTNIFCIFWGCLGISTSSAVGLKYAPEFWVIMILFMATNSALLSYNRVVWASFIPEGSEALLSGLIFMCDLVTGWVLPLAEGAIQDNTHDLRYPMLLPLGLMVASVPFFMWADAEKGSREAGKPLPGRSK